MPGIKRDTVPSEHFAVPGKRKLLIDSDRHTRLAWDMVERTKGLTASERHEAYGRILSRAHALGMDTENWYQVKSVRFECMALNISNDDNHPNKMPFTGVLTKIDEPSDAAPQGSHGKLIMVTREAAEDALGSLLGMSVDFTPSFDGHDPQAKIGLITSADVVGNEIQISGFVYAADFPETAELIQKLKNVLGFSFEAQGFTVEDYNADVLKITGLTFTGAAILQKDKAAYITTSLAAAAAEGLNMTPEELAAILAKALQPLTDRLTQVETNAAAVNDTLRANAAVRAQVEPYCTSMESCAASMRAAGVGAQAKYGHADVLDRMANHMRAEAAMGRVPSIFRDHDYPYNASADTAVDKDKELKTLIASAITEATKPLNDKLAAAETTIADLKAGKRAGADEPGRKTLPPQIQNLMSRAGLTMPEGDGKLLMGEVDKALSATTLGTRERIMVKTQLERIGALG